MVYTKHLDIQSKLEVCFPLVFLLIFSSLVKLNLSFRPSFFVFVFARVIKMTLP